MKHQSRILLGITLFLVILSVSATFYKTVILQDFDMVGANVEFLNSDVSKIWFVFEHKVYEIEVNSTDLNDIKLAVSSELNTDIADLPQSLVEYIELSHSEAELTVTETIEAEANLDLEADSK